MQQFYKGIILVWVVFICTTHFCGFGYAQSSNWLALSNGSGRPLDIKVDQKGSVYSLGTEGGEMEFCSVDSVGPRHHSNVPWSAQFVTKHTPEGKLEFVVHIIATGGNSNTTSAREILILHDNRFVVNTYCKGNYQVIDSRGDSIPFKGNQSSLLIFNEKGQYQSSIDLPLDYGYWTKQLDNGSIYCIGRKRSYGGNGNTSLCRIDLRTQRAELVIEGIYPELADFMVIGNTLWFLDIQVIKSEHYHKQRTYQLSRLNAGSKVPEVVQTYEFGPCRTNDAQLIAVNGEPQIVFRVQPGLIKGVPMNNYQIPYTKDFTEWLFVDSKGSVVKQLTVRCIEMQHSVSTLGNGDYLLRFLVYDSLFIQGEAPITVPTHKQFIYEMVFVHYSSDFRLKDISLSGGVSNTLLSPFVISDDYVYASGLFYENNLIEDEIQKLEWSHGYFIRKRKLKITP